VRAGFVICRQSWQDDAHRIWARRMNSHEPMSKVDTAWLRMERPTNLMMITGVIVLDGALDVDVLRHAIESRFLAFHRFRQRPVELAGQWYWELDDTFDIHWHVRRAALVSPAGKAELQEYVSNLASSPLDPSKPLWQFHLIENYEGGAALVMRIHHCYADGIALVQVLLSLHDTSAHPRHRKTQPTRPQGNAGNVFERLLAPAMHRVEHAAELVESALHKAFDWARDPQAAAESVLGMARTGTHEASEILRELVHALSLADDPATRFKGPLGVFKRVAWCDPLPLADVKAVGKALGATINDVLLACATGALRAYLLECGDRVDGLTIRATVPVNLRPVERAGDLGNRFGLVMLDLPIGLANPVARLVAVRDGMVAIKHSRQAIMTYGLLSALGVGPGMLQRPALELLSRKATAVATNVPGPQVPLFLCGTPVREMMFWVPQSGSIGMGVSILSYAGSVYFGLISDTRLVPDPDRIIGRFASELEKLLLIALMHEGEQPITPESAEHLLAPAKRKPRPRRKSRSSAS
jgi:WS/DGAT/MGAT family acyltransferase